MIVTGKIWTGQWKWRDFQIPQNCSQVVRRLLYKIYTYMLSCILMALSPSEDYVGKNAVLKNGTSGNCVYINKRHSRLPCSFYKLHQRCFSAVSDSGFYVFCLCQLFFLVSYAI